MISSEILVEGKNREELEKLKEEINGEINNYLAGNIPEDQKYVKPSPETIYKMNLEYIKAIDNRLELMNNQIKDFSDKFGIKRIEGELNEVLSLCKDGPIFFSEEKRLLSISEILNSKEEMQLEKDIIPIIDLYDNDFVGYDISSKEFVKFNISNELVFKKLESIREYIDLLKKGTNI